MKTFRDQPIIRKTRILTVAVIIIFALALVLTFGTYWLLGARRTVEAAAVENARNAATTLDRTLRTITESFVSAFGTENFSAELFEMQVPGSDSIHNRIRVQNELMALSSSDPAVLSTLMINTATGETYSLFRDSLIPSPSPVITKAESNSCQGVALLRERQSPIRGQGNILPYVFPIEYWYTMAKISSGPGNFIVVVLISAEWIHSLLPEDSILVNNQGTIVSGMQGTKIPEKDGGSEENGNYLYRTTLPFSGSVIVSRTDLRESFLSLISTGISSLLAAAVILIALFFGLSTMLKRYVTSPVGKLKATVSQIERGNYDAKADFSGNDELGDLRDAISRMGHTIETQIEEIREEQEKQTRTEMQLLSEQLTPHFLYNTLECIQQEIQTGNGASSAEMTRALSLYLRTVLSYGSETITIRDEIQHDMAYIRIMNGRFRKEISYRHEESPRAMDERILKMLLQPFIENSIKHGFGITDGSTWVQQPEIVTSFIKDGDWLRISISDNGEGFDEEKFLSIMKRTGNEGHIGVRNTYQRLIRFYGEENVSISVSSIPYYKSEIIITIPAIRNAGENPPALRSDK